MKSRSGFTIVELLIVIVVIGILAAITVVAYNGIQERAKISIAKTDLQNLNKQMELFKVDHDHYPGTEQAIETLLRNAQLFEATRLTLAEEEAGGQPEKSFAFCLTQDLQEYLIVAFAPVYTFLREEGASHTGASLYYVSPSISGERTLQWDTTVNTISNLCNSVDPIFNVAGDRVHRWSYGLRTIATLPLTP